MSLILRGNDLADGQGFADALCLCMLVVVIGIDVAPGGIFLICHGNDAFDIRNLEIVDSCPDDIERRSGVNPDIEAIFMQLMVEIFDLRRDGDAELDRKSVV